MSSICEMMRLYVESGHIEDTLMLDDETGNISVVYAIRMKKERRKRSQLFMLSYCPGCGTAQNFDKENGPVGLFCTLAGVPLGKLPEREGSGATTG